MPADRPQFSSAAQFASRALLWMNALALVLAGLQFAFAPNTIQAPLVAGLSLLILAISTLLVRSFSWRSSVYQHCVDLGVLTACLTAFAVSTEALRSAALPLFLIPLAGTAVAFATWWAVAIAVGVIALIALVLAAITGGISIASAEFGVILLGAIAPGAGVALILGHLMQKMREASHTISELVTKDALTGLLNLETFEKVLHRQHRKSARVVQPYSILIVDIDNLAHVNESLGHDAGSEIISAVGGAILRSIRTSDVAARLGGDEFFVLLADADPIMAKHIAQRIRNHVYTSTVSVANHLVRANVNVGAASYPTDHSHPQELIVLANQRMREDRERRRASA
ncbi:MAG TPA: GGDEF domain-containing protein [Steroidobacteraceae bacterium]|nr:GGDEF domain-containing protein [Steroidobacteraceae bacterium]